MASHSELRPDDAALPLLIASAALSKAESRLTVATGTVVADNADGTQTWIGSNGSDDTNGVIKWVGDLSAPGRPLGLSAACSMQCVVVSWDGTLEDGVPSDFAYIEIFARREGSVDDVVSWGRLSSAGMLMSPRYDIGTVFDAYAIAYDDAHDSTGMLARNRSEQSDLITVAVEQDADMEQIDAAVEGMSKKADEAGAKAEQVRKDMQSEVDDVRAKVDGLSSAGDRLSGQITDIRGTVNGQQSKLDEFGQKLEGVVTQNGATVKSVTELRQTVSGLDARVSQNTETAEGAMSKATTVQQTADGIKTTLSKDYTSTKDADRKYSTKTELTTEAGRIRAELSETTKTANGAMDKSATLETTVNGISTRISEQATTLDATVKTANEAKSTADSNKTAISQVSTTANDALSKTSSLEQNLSGFKTSVANTYTTKADFNNLTIGGTNLLLNTSGVFVGHPSTSGVGADAGWLPLLVDGLTYSTLSAGTYQLRFEVMTDTEVGSYIVQWAGTPWGISSFSLSKGVWKTLTYTIVKPDGATGKARGFMLRTDNVPTSATIRVRRAKLERGSRPTDWSPAPQDSQAAGDYATNSSLTQTANQIRGEVSEKYQPKSGMSSYATVSALSQKANEITGRVQEVAKTAQGNTTTISQVSQKADRINTTLSQKIDGKADTSRVSSLEQNLDGFKTGVAKTYQTKGDYPTKAEVQSRIDQTSRSVALGVVQNYKGADGSGLATKSDISVSRTEITSEVSNTYATKDGVSKEISSKITQNNSSLEVKFSNAGSIEYVTNGSFRENLDGWTVADGQWVINGSDNALQYYKAVSAGASTLGPLQNPSALMGTSTRQRLIRRSFDIANYSNASGATLRMSCRLNDGTWSGEYPSVELDSTFDWMHVDMVETIPAGKYIDRVVPVMRATNACTVNVEVRNFSLRDITDSYKSADAVINMTGQGVRVGKNRNGAWTGMSALVGTDATFDVLDTSGKRLLEVSATGVKFPHSKDGTRLALGYVAGSGSASDTLYIGDIITGQQEGGPKNRLGFTGDEVSLEGGDISINANDNQLSLYGRKGANLLVPDGGNVQVGGQSGTSNTTLTLRGSTVNMSGGLVNVNGRTLNAPVDAKQSQRWDNIQLDVKCVNRVVTVNVLHPLGSNAVVGDQSDQCEIGYIKEGYRPSRMIGCHLAAYNTTNLFLEINPSTGKVACFRLWGNQNTWAYFSASLSYVI